mgnify:CR=1 FL=1
MNKKSFITGVISVLILIVVILAFLKFVGKDMEEKPIKRASTAEIYSSIEKNQIDKSTIESQKNLTAEENKKAESKQSTDKANTFIFLDEKKESSTEINDSLEKSTKTSADDKSISSSKYKSTQQIKEKTNNKNNNSLNKVTGSNNAQLPVSKTEDQEINVNKKENYGGVLIKEGKDTISEKKSDSDQTNQKPTK